MESQKDDTISLHVCKVFLIIMSAPSQKMLPASHHMLCSQLISPSVNHSPPKPHHTTRSWLLSPGCFLEEGDVGLLAQQIDPVALQGHRNEFRDPFANHTTGNEPNVFSKEKKTFIIFLLHK